MNKQAKNIVDFWNSVEKFTPCQIETDNDKKPYHVDNIQREVLEDYDIAWLNRDRFKHFATKKKTWVYTVFLGIIEIDKVTTKIKTLLKSDSPDYDLESINGVSCIASFQVNINGNLIENSLNIPDYFLSMSTIALKEEYPEEWLSYRDKIAANIKDVFDNLCDELNIKNKKDKVKYKNIEHLLNSFLEVSKLSSLLTDSFIKNTAVIYSSNLPISKSKEGEELQDESSAIINSFFIEDLTKVSNILENQPKAIGKSLEQYLEIKTRNKEFDLCSDKNLNKEFSHFSLLPPARWPGKGDFPLALSQQLAVNLSLQEDEGLFSVNGPPGTGKTTLLRDIISGVILKRAKVLSKLDDPNDAFIDPVNFQIDQYNYKAWLLKPELLGHEIFIASSNNNAVENISREIPLASQIDEKWKVDYFAEISSFVLGKESWGLGSAVLGNSKNRNKFFDNFWDKKPATKPETASDKFYGLEYFLKEMAPKKDWQQTKTSFLEELDNYEKIEKKLYELEKSLKQVTKLEEEISIAKDELNKLQQEESIIDGQINNKSQEQKNISQDLERKKDSIKFHKEAKPSIIEIVIEIFHGLKNYTKWRYKYSQILEEFESLNNSLTNLNQEIADLEGRKAIILKQILNLNSSLDSNQNELNKKLSLINEYKMLMGDNFPDDKFWQLSDDKLQLRLPWNFPELHNIRAKLFVKALELHEAFIINSSQRLMNNLRIIKRRMAQGLPEGYNNLMPHIWATFFCVVPTVSTTFASFTNLCRELKANDIGYLLIDEAGQAVPQAGLGAIYRSKRTVIVGDPMQIKPVITTPKAIIDALKDYHDIKDDLFNPIEQSIQTLADRGNSFGTFIGKDENRKWVGCPLRIHRRCQDPMFKISNNIAYDNLMISATKNKKSTIEDIFLESIWFDVTQGQVVGNWLPEEGKVVLKILTQIIQNNKKLPNLYVISPFKTVVNNMKKLLSTNISQVFGSYFNKKEIFEWINKSIGTIHTFQGREAEAIILLLGGNPNKPGSLNWAAKEPNILNVGLTRAKNLVLVVGNHEAWSKRKYFQDLSFELKTKSVSSQEE